MTEPTRTLTLADAGYLRAMADRLIDDAPQISATIVPTLPHAARNLLRIAEAIEAAVAASLAPSIAAPTLAVFQSILGNQQESELVFTGKPDAEPTPSAPEAPFRLEEGKRYVDRAGNITGPLLRDKENTLYPLFCPKTGRSYTEDGCYYHPNHLSSADLVSEYVEPAETNSRILAETAGDPERPGMFDWDRPVPF